MKENHTYKRITNGEGTSFGPTPQLFTSSTAGRKVFTFRTTLRVLKLV